MVNSHDDSRQCIDGVFCGQVKADEDWTLFCPNEAFDQDQQAVLLDDDRTHGKGGNHRWQKGKLGMTKHETTHGKRLGHIELIIELSMAHMRDCESVLRPT